MQIITAGERDSHAHHVTPRRNLCSGFSFAAPSVWRCCSVRSRPPLPQLIRAGAGVTIIIITMAIRAGGSTARGIAAGGGSSASHGATFNCREGASAQAGALFIAARFAGPARWAVLANQ